jgi:hypothetical protein
LFLKQKDRLAAVSPNPIRCFDQAAIAAAFFFVPRCAKKPRPTKPLRSMNHVDGSGVVTGSYPIASNIAYSGLEVP